MKLTILQLAPLYQSISKTLKYGGIERIVMGLDEHFVKNGAKSFVAALRGSEIKGLLVESDSGEARYAEQADKVLNFLKHEAVDVVHIHRRDFLKTEAFNFCKKQRIPVLYTLHGPAQDLMRKFDFSIFYEEVDNLFFNAVSYAQARDLSGKFSIVEVINNGVELDLFHYDAEKSDYLFTFGRIAPEKGVHSAILLAKRCRRKLIIGGSIQDQGYYESMVRPYIDGVNVEFLGALTDEQKIPFFRKASALLMLVECEDSCPLVALEALACGTPVIAFKKGGLLEIVEHGKTGFLIDTIEEGVQAVQNLTRIKHIDCRRSIKSNFSLEQMAQKYLRLYLKLRAYMNHDEKIA